MIFEFLRLILRGIELYRVLRGLHIKTLFLNNALYFSVRLIPRRFTKLRKVLNDVVGLMPLCYLVI